MSFFLYSLFVLAIVAADQITKYLVVANIPRMLNHTELGLRSAIRGENRVK